MPSTSVPVECLPSVVGQVVTAKKASLDTHTLTLPAFLHEILLVLPTSGVRDDGASTREKDIDLLVNRRFEGVPIHMFDMLQYRFPTRQCVRSCKNEFDEMPVKLNFIQIWI